MRNILKWYHEIIAISVTLSAWTGWTAIFTPAALWPVYSLSSLPIGTQIQLVQIEWVDTYVFLHNNNEIWTLTITPGSWYDFDSVEVNGTSVTTTPITLQDWDAIYVAFRSAELLLARNTNSWYELVWDGVDSLWFKFQHVWIYDSSISDYKYYSGEIWMADTDYPMPQYNYITPLPPELVTTYEIQNAMMSCWWNNLYVPWNIIAQNVYDNSTWQGSADLSTYDWTPSQAWADAHFVNTLEWSIIWNMFVNWNEWEDASWTSFASITWVQIPWTLVQSSYYNRLVFDPNSSTDIYSLRDSYLLWFIPWDYYIYKSSYNYTSAIIGTSGDNYIPRSWPMEFDISHSNKSVNLWKMRVLNTTKTNYSLDS